MFPERSVRNGCCCVLALHLSEEWISGYSEGNQQIAEGYWHMHIAIKQKVGANRLVVNAPTHPLGKH